MRSNIIFATASVLSVYAQEPPAASTPATETNPAAAPIPSSEEQKFFLLPEGTSEAAVDEKVEADEADPAPSTETSEEDASEEGQDNEDEDEDGDEDGDEDEDEGEDDDEEGDEEVYEDETTTTPTTTAAEKYDVKSTTTTTATTKAPTTTTTTKAPTTTTTTKAPVKYVEEKEEYVVKTSTGYVKGYPEIKPESKPVEYKAGEKLTIKTKAGTPVEGELAIIEPTAGNPEKYVTKDVVYVESKSEPNKYMKAYLVVEPTKEPVKYANKTPVEVEPLEAPGTTVEAKIVKVEPVETDKKAYSTGTEVEAYKKGTRAVIESEEKPYELATGILIEDYEENFTEAGIPYHADVSVQVESVSGPGEVVTGQLLPLKPLKAEKGKYVAKKPVVIKPKKVIEGKEYVVGYPVIVPEAKTVYTDEQPVEVIEAVGDFGDDAEEIIEGTLVITENGSLSDDVDPEYSTGGEYQRGDLVIVEKEGSPLELYSGFVVDPSTEESPAIIEPFEKRNDPKAYVKGKIMLAKKSADGEGLYVIDKVVTVEVKGKAGTYKTGKLVTPIEDLGEDITIAEGKEVLIEALGEEDTTTEGTITTNPAHAAESRDGDEPEAKAGTEPKAGAMQETCMAALGLVAVIALL